MNRLQLNTPVPDKYTTYLKKVEHEQLTIAKDLEMIHKIAVVFYTNDNGNFGEPLLEVINQDDTLSSSQRQQLRDRFRTVFYESNTRNKKVMLDGTPVEPDPETGQYPEDVELINELQLWQGIPADQIPGTLISEKVYALMTQSMANMAERERI
jgi:hypothetical protein